jgi:short-subunit dehydrogenase
MTELKKTFGEWAIIAGATEGIGEQFSLQLAKKGMNILLIARKQEGLDKVSKQITDNYPSVKTETLSLDLSDPELTKKVSAFAAGKEIGLVVYNAVYSYIGDFVDDTLESQQLCLDVNCKGPLTFINVFKNQMIQRKRGAILLVSSMSGFQGSAMVSTYAASKAFVTVLAEGLWFELKEHGVHVMACVAGATLTPNFERQTPAQKIASVMPMTPKAVVEEALTALEKKKGPTIIVGKLNKFVSFLFGRVFSRKQAVNTISKATQNLYKES